MVFCQMSPVDDVHSAENDDAMSDEDAERQASHIGDVPHWIGPAYIHIRLSAIVSPLTGDLKIIRKDGRYRYTAIEARRSRPCTESTICVLCVVSVELDLALTLTGTSARELNIVLRDEVSCGISSFTS